LGKGDEGGRTCDHIHAADDGGFNAAGSQSFDRLVERHERGRTGRIYRETWTMQVINIRNAIGDDR
jgi:hypothetical protein